MSMESGRALFARGGEGVSLTIALVPRAWIPVSTHENDGRGHRLPTPTCQSERGTVTPCLKYDHRLIVTAQLVAFRDAVAPESA